VLLLCKLRVVGWCIPVVFLLYSCWVVARKQTGSHLFELLCFTTLSLLPPRASCLFLLWLTRNTRKQTGLGGGLLLCFTTLSLRPPSSPILAGSGTKHATSQLGSIISMCLGIWCVCLSYLVHHQVP
jgi:hypothetical protein